MLLYAEEALEFYASENWSSSHPPCTMSRRTHRTSEPPSLVGRMTITEFPRVFKADGVYFAARIE